MPQDTLVWLPLTLALEHRRSDPGLMLLLGLSDSQLIGERLEQLRATLVARHGFSFADPQRLRIDSAAALRDSLDGVSRAIRLLLLAFGLILFCVAGFGVSALTLSAIAERIREIGVHKALGASRAALLQQILAETALVSGAGIAAGGSAAWLLSGLLSQAMPFLPALSLPPGLALAVCLGALMIAVSSAIVPAARGAGLDPIEALREVRG
jgi:putative ABC transport system permease protein